MNFKLISMFTFLVVLIYRVFITLLELELLFARKTITVPVPLAAPIAVLLSFDITVLVAVPEITNFLR